MTSIANVQGIHARSIGSTSPTDASAKAQAPPFTRGVQTVEKDKAQVSLDAVTARLCEKFKVPGTYSFPFQPGPGRVRVYSENNMMVSDVSDQIVKIKNGAVSVVACVDAAPFDLLNAALSAH